MYSTKSESKYNSASTSCKIQSIRMPANTKPSEDTMGRHVSKFPQLKSYGVCTVWFMTFTAS